MWSYWSGCILRQSSRSCSSSAGNHGLSDQLALATIEPVGSSSPRNVTSTGSVLSLGFQLAHISELGLRIVGLSKFHERELTVWASSTHAASKPSYDLIDSAEWS